MERKPRTRLGILIFAFVFLGITGAIAATVLMANNQRNLKRLARAIGLPMTETMVIPKPGTMERFKGKRLKDVTLMIDPYVFMPEIKDRSSVFLRNMRKDGKTLCALFTEAGFAMSTWQAGSFATKINECWYEESIPNAEKPDEPSSFFLMIKGAADGTLISTRVKFIFTDTAARTRVTEMAAKVLDRYATITHWTEIAGERQKLLALQPFSTTVSGLSVRFSSEFSAPGRYNLIFARATAQTPAQKRTEQFFDRGNYMRLTPDYGGPPLPVEETKT
jgi:hypothetical protein